MVTSGGFVLVNTAEQAVRAKVSDIMANTDMCKCEKCYTDACMHALNRMQNKYVTSKKGEVLSNVNTSMYENTVALIVATATAIGIVHDNPQH